MATYSLGTAHGIIQIDANTNGVNQANQALGGLTSQSQTTGQAVDRLGTGMGIAGAAVAGGLGLAVKTAADFEQELSGIAAVSGATAGQMQQVHDKALQIGKSTAFGATEAAQAMAELSKAGLSVDDILNGAADATVALAAAGGVDMPTAATIASNAMNQFGLTAGDMVHTVDLIAGAANASAIDVTDLGMSMSAVGAVANLAGLNFDETATAIAEMGNAGIKGSDAGTSLKSMLMNLQPTTEAASNAMKDLGLMTEDGSNLFYDQQGNLKSLTDIQELLHQSTKDLTEGQKTQALETIFGSDAIRAAAVMANEGAAGYDKMNQSMLKTSAAEVAKVRMDNMKGSLENMKGALETAAISIGEVLIPPLTKLIEFVGVLFDKFNALSPGMQQVITYVALGAASFLLLGAGMVKVVRTTQSIFAALGTVTRALFGTTAANGTAQAGFLRTAATSTVSAAKTAAGWVAAAASATWSFLKMAATAIAQSAVIAAQWAAGVAKTIASWALMAAQATLNAAKVAGAWLLQNGAAVASSLASMAVAVAATVAGWLAMAAQAIISAAIIAIQWIIAFWPILLVVALIAGAVVLIIMYWDNIVAAIKAAASWIADLMVEIWNGIKAAWEWIGQVFQNALALVTSIFQSIWNAIKAAFAWIINTFIQSGQNIWNSLQQTWNFIVNVWNTIMGFLGGLPGKILGVFAAAASWLYNAGRNVLQGLWNGLTGMWGAVWGWLGNIGSWIMNALSGAGSWLWNAGSNIIQGLWNGISSAGGWIMGKVRGLMNSIKDGVLGFFGIHSPSRVFRDEVGKNLMLGLAVGIDDNAGRAVQAALDAATAVTGSVTMASAGAPDAFWDGTALGSGSVPVSPEVASYAASQGEAPTTNITTNIYNPVVEDASDSEARRLRTLSAMGAF